MHEDKRKHPHIAINTFVRFWAESDDPMFTRHYKGVVKNYSEGGLCILTDHPLFKGCLITMELPIQSERHGLAIVELRGRVRWVRQFEGRRGMGVEFLEFSGSTNRDFAAWMTNLHFDDGLT